MAMALIRQWHLAVLRVRLDLTQAQPAVVTGLVSYAGAEPRSLWTRRNGLTDFGLNGSGPPGDLRMPDGLRDAVAAALRDDLGNESSLWVRLEPPYGHLGAVPWEQALAPVTGVPVLRVPDRLPHAGDPGQRWSLAVGISAMPGTAWSGRYLAELVQAVQRETGPAEIDVFADAGTVEQVRALRLPAWDWLHVHEPATARAASRDRRRRLSTSQARPSGGGGTAGRIWADWIATGLAGRAVRALHVVLDGAWDGDRPVLSVPADPSQPADPELCGYVGAEDVVRLADAMGAATLSFGSPPGAGSDTAVRVIADHLGQQRPGATVYSSIAGDPQGSELAGVQAFLAGRETPVPQHPSLFAYLQPEQVRPVLATDWPDVDPQAPQPALAPRPATVTPGSAWPEPDSGLRDLYAGADIVPNWVAASERYIGTQRAGMSQPASTPASVSDKQAYDEGASQGLAELQAMLVKHVRPS